MLKTLLLSAALFVPSFAFAADSGTSAGSTKTQTTPPKSHTRKNAKAGTKVKGQGRANNRSQKSRRGRSNKGSRATPTK